jgi:hypothetical protein
MDSVESLVVACLGSRGRRRTVEIMKSEDSMRERNRRHGRKSSGRKHGGQDMKRAGKRHRVQKKSRSGRVESRTPFERKRRALMEAASRTVAQLSLPPPPPIPEIAPAYARSLAQLVEATSVPAPQAFRKAVRVGPMRSRGRVAVMAFVMAAMGGVVLVRACEPKAAPIDDDAAETDSCSDDASLCVARA